MASTSVHFSGTERYVFVYDESGNPHELHYYSGNATIPTKYYYVLNLQGDVIQLRDANNVSVANYTYDAWGKFLSVTDENGNEITSARHIGILNPIRYRGYFYDNETKLYYCNSRYYDPQIRRFINADGYMSTGQGFAGFNMFAYCNNNPVMYCDPDGTSIIGTLLGITAVLTICLAPVVDMGVQATAATANLAGIEYLEHNGYDLAAEMYDYAFSREGGKLEYDSLPPMMEDKLINSDSLHDELQNYIDENSLTGYFDTKDQTIEFKLDKEPDLYYAIQNASYRAWGWIDEGQWKINIFVWDTYDFGECRLISEGVSFANAANDMGTFFEALGQMIPYEWWIRYEYYY